MPPVDSSRICHLAPGLKHHSLFRIQESMVGHAVTILRALSSTMSGHTHGPVITTPNHYRWSTCQRDGLTHTARSYVLSKRCVASEHGIASGVSNGMILAAASCMGGGSPVRHGSPVCYRCWSKSRVEAQVGQHGNIGDWQKPHHIVVGLQRCNACSKVRWVDSHFLP
jgi:hypothetical protein